MNIKRYEDQFSIPCCRTIIKNSEQKIVQQVGNHTEKGQFVFRRGVDTRDAIQVLSLWKKMHGEDKKSVCSL